MEGEGCAAALALRPHNRLYKKILLAQSNKSLLLNGSVGSLLRGGIAWGMDKSWGGVEVGKSREI